MSFKVYSVIQGYCALWEDGACSSGSRLVATAVVYQNLQ